MGGKKNQETKLISKSSLFYIV